MLDLTSHAASGTSETSAQIIGTFGVNATNKTWMRGEKISGSPSTLGVANALTTNLSLQVYNTTTSDLTGTQTVSLAAYSDGNTATQTLHLIAWKITKIASNP